MKKNTLKFSKKIIILMFLSMFVFTAVMVLTFWKMGSVPDSLIEAFFAFFGFEGGALGIIKVSEVIGEKFEKKSKGSKKK